MPAREASRIAIRAGSTGPEAAIERASRGSGRMLLYDAKGMSLLVFDELWTLRSTQQHETTLTFHEVAPQ